MKILPLCLCVLLLTACGSQTQPTPTPTKTPVPTLSPTFTPVPTVPAATDTPVPPTITPSLGEAMAANVLAKAGDDAYLFVIQHGVSEATHDQMIGALVGVLGRLPETLKRVASNATTNDDDILFDACHEIGSNLALGAKTIEAGNYLNDLAFGCTGLKLDIISGADPAGDIAKLDGAMMYLNGVLAFPK